MLILGEGAGRGALVREACARLARNGFVAHAPQPPAPGGSGPSEDERRCVDTALHALLCEHATEGAHLGVIGFGRGGLLALDAAARSARVAVAVSLDGPCEPAALDALALGTVDGAVLVLAAEKFPGVERGDVEALSQRLREEGVRAEVRVLPGVAEGFLDPDRPDRYDAVAARASWDAALARLRGALG